MHEKATYLLSSRKIWAAVMGTISILIAGFFFKENAEIAIEKLGWLWLVVIGGQATYDGIKQYRTKLESKNGTTIT